ncbi:MAG: hypothetical protein Pg6A_16200 [Termitinemataceae bacterium]|nr:MAG: hypothetical protein Pg6A_16200 [Termitinemataceae bacterium]
MQCGRKVGARLTNAAVVLGFAVLAAIGFAACKLSGEAKDDEPDGGSQFVPISLSKTEDVIFKDEVSAFTSDESKTKLTAEVNAGLLPIVDLVWSVTGDNILTNPPAGSKDATVPITPNGNKGKAVLTATIASKTDPQSGTPIIEGLESIGHLSASYELTVLEPPVLTLSAVGTIMLGDGGDSIPVDLSANYNLDDNTPDEWIPALDNSASSFAWEFVSGEDSAEFVSGTENVSNTGASITLNAKSAGTVTVRGKLTLPGKVVKAETTFSIIDYDRTQVPHKTITIENKFSDIVATDTKTVKLNFTPSDALLSSIVWEYDSGKFTVTPVSKDEIKITAKPGVSSQATYTIRAKSNVTGANAKDDFTVNLKPLDVTITGSVTEISKGGAATYTASTNAVNQSVSWSVEQSSNNVTMSGGVLTNTKSANETVKVKATSQADTSRSKTINVSVKPPKFTVKYDANNGSGTSTTETTVRTYGVPFNLATNTYTKTGYSFSGWSTTSSGSVVYTDGQQNVNNIDPSANNAVVTLYAVWAIANYSITYNNMTGATNHASNPAAYTYETNTITLQTPTKAGYTFGGWFSNASFTGAAVTQIAKGSTGDKTLYAKWESTIPIADANSADLMVKFSVKSAGYALSSISTTDVTNTFNTVKDYLATQSASSVNPADGLGVIKLGDYVELPSLTVSAYNGNGGGINITSNANNGKLQLMVVGINPYYGKNGNADTPHLIFHFKDYPGYGRMHASKDANNAGGYKLSEIRTYLMTNYWAALQTAGVPDSAVWAVKRVGANDGVATGTDTIEDKLWLPTEWEMFGSNSNSNSNYENSANQGRLNYYKDANSRKKANLYLTASPAKEAYWWCGIGSDGNSTRWIEPPTTAGVSPAFAVSGADQPPSVAIKTVSYNANGGTGSALQAVITGGSVTVRDGSGFTRANYLFDGWNTNTAGSGTSYNAGDTISNITQDITLYAKWKPGLDTSSPGNTTWIIPETTTYVIEVWGAQGSKAASTSVYNEAGKGGYSKGEINLTAGQTLDLTVGAKEGGGAGGSGGSSDRAGVNGHGLSGVKLNSAWLIVAGGGGGGGGRATGGNGGINGGTGGSGGGYGIAATAGTKGTNEDSKAGAGGGINGPSAGGAGANADSRFWDCSGGGGGGSGYPNGGSGGGVVTGYYSCAGGGGGGGSGYADTTKMTNLSGQAGVREGNGMVKIYKK